MRKKISFTLKITAFLIVLLAALLGMATISDNGRVGLFAFAAMLLAGGTYWVAERLHP